jgi:lipopolysaccharide/colanic/teichoic acid biosynthesis glycosyltransferase
MGRRGPRWRRDAVQRAFDLTLCLATAPLWLPLLGLLALVVRLDSPGPVLFSQQRTGRDGQRFRLWKFRTMVANAEELKASLQHLNVLPWPDFKIPDDPRITRVGRLLRRTSLDELPQLFNVLRGEMSLVGPRPTSFDVSDYELWHSKRLEVRPGLTGLWQLHGRNHTSFDERLRMDITYVERRSLWLDLRIVLATSFVLVRGTGE